LIVKVSECGTRVARCMTRLLDNLDKDVRAHGRGLGEPQRLVEEAAERLDDRIERTGRALRVLIEARTREIGEAAGKLVTPRQLIRMKADRFQTALRDAQRAWDALARDKRNALRNVQRLLDGVSYQRVLDRGFALVTNARGQAITEATAVQGGMALDIRFRDGHVPATADGEKPAKKPKAAKSSDKQGSLL
jgi:exodeoxyribonuclease VII large subunit